ncbi:MAG: SpoIIIAH-like family protein [Bacilli bacterium]|nr:SpoIIIAH-like family protein [Bacilli bacterium]
MNKQNLWFITLFSIVLILSIYYISIPNNLLEEYTSSSGDSNNTSEVVNESSILVSLRVQDDEETLNTINELNTILLDKNKSKEEKNTAYESLKSINETKGLEEQIETMLKDEFKYDSFVKISKDQINIVISSSEHNKDIANNIIKKVQSMYNTKKYITIKFQ